MYFQLKGLILKTAVSAEADKLATIYSYEWGKVTINVPGAKKVTAKYGAHSEPVTENEFMVYARHARSRPKVTGVKPLSRFPGLYKDWRRCVAAQYCAEVMDAIVPYNSPNPKKYDLLRRTWELLERVENPRRIVQGFIVRFLHLSGYSFTEFLKQYPELVPRGDHKIIKQLACLSGDDLDCMAEWPAGTEDTADRYIHRYLDLYLNRRLSTKVFLEKIDVHEEKCMAVAE